MSFFITGKSRCHIALSRSKTIVGRYGNFYREISSTVTKAFGDDGGSSRRKGNSKLSQSSRNWLRRQEKDEYTKRARDDGSPSRSIFKLEEIMKSINNMKKNKKAMRKNINFDFLQKNDIVIDLGAAPGGWSLYTSRLLGSEGLLISVDLLPLASNVVNSISFDEKMPHFHAIEGDFTDSVVKEEVTALVNKYNRKDMDGNIPVGKVDCIISDMAANFTGDKITDALRTLNLCEDAMMFAAGSSCFDTDFDIDDNDGLLRSGGTFICKFFACGQDNEEDLMTAAKTRFQYTNIIKPKSSRKESAELYLYATGFKNNQT